MYAWSIYKVYAVIYFLFSRISPSTAVRGCVTYVAGNDYSMRQSICDKLDTHFNKIPPSLPSEVVKLIVNNQEISTLDADQFSHLPNLTHLNLDSNKIAHIAPRTFHALTRLETLSLRFNNLYFSPTSFHPDSLSGLVALQSLNLFQNPIGRVSSFQFSAMGETLRALIVAGASSDFRLEIDSLAGLPRLQILDLSFNHLTTLPNYFENNLEEMTALKELYLHGNAWHCDCRLRWLRLWLIRHGSQIVYYKYTSDTQEGSFVPSEVPPSHGWQEHVDPTLNDHSLSIVEPHCSSPEILAGRPLFKNPATIFSEVSIDDLYCSPQILTKSQSLILTSGTNSTLECNFFADPTGTVYWYHDGSKLQLTSPRISMQQDRGQNFSGRLTIHNINANDSGMYACFLDTGYGSVNTTFDVRVTSTGSITGSGHGSTIFQWVSQLDTMRVLKYTGIAASCLIMLLACIGGAIYCFYGRKPRHGDDKTKNRPCSVPVNAENGPSQTKPVSNCSSIPSTVSASGSRSDSIPTNLTAQPLTQSFDTSPTDHASANYVAFHLVSTDANNTAQLNSMACPLHNYAVLRSIGPNESSSLLITPTTTPNQTSINVAKPTSSSTGNASVIDASNSTERSFQPETTGTPPMAYNRPDFSEPCPLHGHIYATLTTTKSPQNSTNGQSTSLDEKKKKPEKHELGDSKLHIATIPPGLASFDRDHRRNTLPHRKKAPPLVNDLYNTKESSRLIEPSKHGDQ